jgi:hypothetical protein
MTKSCSHRRHRRTVQYPICRDSRDSGMQQRRPRTTCHLRVEV